ncbi:MAG: PKD domain-containing protein, partial [Flavobacteriales bacterium]|nr:PKD domain-containing protein [Flavobacteriales bacterium]
MRTLAMAVIAVLAIQTAQAQFYTIADGYVAACTGALLDSGGEGASGYGDNENYTMYICPDGSGGPGISLQWLTFNLSTAGALPIDQLAIYDGLLDGVNPDPPLLGIYDGNNPPNITSASFENVQNTVNGGGCLTLVFTSNATGTGVFAAAISCFAPCEPPTASATVGAATPLYVCQGEPVTFDGNASVAASPFNIVEYNWDFDNGETDNSGPVVTHSFDEPGEYVVQLYVTDDNDCVNTNRTDLAIWVSTTPNFSNITPNTTICEGEQVPLTVDVEAVTWSDLPGSNLGDGIFLPDDQGVPFTSTITFSTFAPGQTLENIDDLLSVCVDMEHSFMGDLVVQLTCPSGQTVTMHQQGGGGTFLGEAVDDESQPDVQGVCWNYCWSPTATNGTWVDNSGNGSPLASGTYESVNPMDVLVGCQLNGTWTFTITDLWAIDNGFLCNWGLNFDGSLFPELTSFTPVLGISTADSASWQGNGVALDPQNPLQGVATPVGVGEYDYVFSVTDNFGCTYDTSFVITVNPGIQGPINITGNNTICDGSIAYLNAP